MTAPYSPEQEERIREALEELCDQIGVEAAAGRLCTTETGLSDLLAGRRPAKAMLVGLLAKQLDETVESLLDPARQPRRPQTTGTDQAIPPAPPASPLASLPNVPPIIGPAGATAPPVAAPLLAIEPPAPPSVSAPVARSPEPRPITAHVPPVGTTPAVSAAPPRTEAPVLQSAADDEPKLTLLEYASLSMGLELLPHRTHDVLAHFGLADPAAQQRETEHWTKFLDAHPREKREWAPMRERMRRHWLRFDGQIAAPAQAEEPRAPSVPAAPVAPKPGAPISLEAYAALCAELHFAPANTEATFAFYGLGETHLRDPVSRYWTERLAHYPNERAEWEQLYRAKSQELSTRASHAPAAPMPRQYIAAVKTIAAETAPSMSLAVYALLCVELEKASDREKVYKRHGLQDPARRRAIEEEWRARLEQDPTEMAKWRKLTGEIRDEWIDL